MRFLLFLVFLAGAAAGIGYPFVAERVSGGTLGTWRLYTPVAGFRQIEIPLQAEDAPLIVAVELSAPAPFVPEPKESSATITVARNNKTLLAKAVAFEDATLRDDNPQTPERSFRAEAGTLTAIEDGKYTFTIARGEAEIPQVTALDLVLVRGPTALERRVQPVGFTLMAVGFVGFMLTLLRRSAPAAPGAPPKPRWGRNATE